jgi:hypothetical protein
LFVLAATLLAIVSSLALVIEILPVVSDGPFAILCRFIPCPTTEPIEPETPEAKITRLTEAVRRQPGSPYPWCDLGEALEEVGDTDKSIYCMRRAAELGDTTASVLMRVAEFHFRRDDEVAALRATSQILHLVESYDDIVFDYYADSRMPVSSILEVGLPKDARPRQAFFEHSLNWADPEEEILIWESLVADSLTSDALASGYIDYLINRGMCEQASQVWVNYLGERRGAYRQSNWLFNGDFEQRPTGAAFDWRTSPVEGSRAEWTTEARSGKSALRLVFDATANVNYRNISQIACLAPGRYVFRAWVRTAGITTDQAPYFRIHDLGRDGKTNVNTAQFQEIADWTSVEATFVVIGAPHPVVIEICRDSSLKLDNKIAGTVWIDDLELKPIAGGQ